MTTGPVAGFEIDLVPEETCSREVADMDEPDKGVRWKLLFQDQITYAAQSLNLWKREISYGEKNINFHLRFMIGEDP